MVLTGFAGLDGLTGGLQEQKNYLLYGNIGTGKTTFSLQFIYQGLVKGETVVLVTRRSAPTVFDHGRAFGLDLEPFLRSHQLILLEYGPKVIENSMRLKEAPEVVREFAAFLGKEKFQRLVFDPITPLLSTPSSSIAVFRARSLIQSFAELGATCVYIFDTPEGEEYLANCKDFVFGVLRFEAGPFQASQGRMVLERMPGLKGRPAQFDFEVTTGVGLVEIAAPAAGARSAGGDGQGQRKVLIIDPDSEQRKILRGLLDKSHTLLEADGVADGLAKVAADSPDLIILERQTRGLDGIEICKKLRQNKLNLPIVVIANQMRRARDRVEIMSAGADECLEKPVDGRILKLKVQNLLRRYDSSRDRFAAGPLSSSVTTALERDRTTSTTNLAYFYDRIRREITYSTENDLSFSLVVLHFPDSSPLHQELASLVGSLIREYDLIYVGDRRVAVLLSEADAKGLNVYLNRLRQRWTRTPAPTAEHLCFDGKANFLQAAKQLVEGVKRAESPTAEVHPPRA